MASEPISSSKRTAQFSVVVQIPLALHAVLIKVFSFFSVSPGEYRRSALSPTTTYSFQILVHSSITIIFPSYSFQSQKPTIQEHV